MRSKTWPSNFFSGRTSQMEIAISNGHNDSRKDGPFLVSAIVPRLRRMAESRGGTGIRTVLSGLWAI